MEDHSKLAQDLIGSLFGLVFFHVQQVDPEFLSGLTEREKQHFFGAVTEFAYENFKTINASLASIAKETMDEFKKTKMH